MSAVRHSHNSGRDCRQNRGGATLPRCCCCSPPVPFCANVAALSRRNPDRHRVYVHSPRHRRTRSNDEISLLAPLLVAGPGHDSFFVHSWRSRTYPQRTVTPRNMPQRLFSTLPTSTIDFFFFLFSRQLYELESLLVCVKFLQNERKTTKLCFRVTR